MTDPASKPTQASSRSSSRVEPFWLNPATIKGTLAILAGLTLLFAPMATVFLLRFVIGAVLVVGGVSDLWFKARGRDDGKIRGVLESVIAIVAGIFLLVWPGATVRVLTVVIGAYLAVRGVAVIGASVSQRRRGDPWIIDITRGFSQIALGVIVLIIPQAAILGVLTSLAVVAVIIGAIMLAYGIRTQTEEELIDIDAATVSQLLFNWLDARDIGEQHRKEVSDGLFFEEPYRVAKLTAWWVMLLLSVAIATFGIMQDSTAVVIGAMLIAPLMTPILGASAGIVSARRRRIIDSFGLVVLGVGASIALAFIIGQWIPVIVPLDVNSQVVSRTSPNVVDMLIALAAGAAGAYANVDRRVSASIAGVAIAVALVPPLGVVGLALEAGQLADAFGAFLLFLTNFVSIVLAATVVFFLTGYAPFQELKQNRAEVGPILRTVVIAALIIMLPLFFTAEGVLSTAGRTDSAQSAVGDWLGEDSTLTALRVSVDGADVDVFLTGSGEVPPIEDLADLLTESFGIPAGVRVEYAETMVVEYTDSQDGTGSALQP
jgi:uncharacterized hydrophobic protein (TIGR00271 family)